MGHCRAASRILAGALLFAPHRRSGDAGAFETQYIARSCTGGSPRVAALRVAAWYAASGRAAWRSACYPRSKSLTSVCLHSLAAPAISGIRNPQQSCVGAPAHDRRLWRVDRKRNRKRKVSLSRFIRRSRARQRASCQTLTRTVRAAERNSRRGRRGSTPKSRGLGFQALRSDGVTSVRGTVPHAGRNS